MARIQLTRGYLVIVDDEDYDRLSEHRWCAQPKYSGVYAYRMSHRTEPYEKRHPIPMASDILGTPRGVIVDHINGDTLDNRKSNLRVASHIQNMRNRGLQKNNTHGAPGLTYLKDRSKPWRVTIRIGEKWPKYIGCYPTKEEAISAQSAAKLQYHGEFSRG